MSKKLYSLFLLPILLSSTATSRVQTKTVTNGTQNITVENYVETEAGSGGARAESNVSTTINGENVTVKTDQPGSVEVKNIDGKVEIKTSEGITPTIVVTGVPTDIVKQEIKIEEEKSASPTAFSKIMNKQTRSIYSFFKGFFIRVFKPFFRKT